MDDVSAGRMAASQILVFTAEQVIFSAVAASLPPSVPVAQVTTVHELETAFGRSLPSLLVVVLPPGDCRDVMDLSFLSEFRGRVPLVLVASDHTVSVPLLSALISCHPLDLIPAPFQPEMFRDAVRKALDDGVHENDEPILEVTLADANRRLNERLQEINTIYTVGKSVASSLDAREILDRVVLAAVNLTQADDGFIVMLEGDRLFRRVMKTKADRYTEHLHSETSDKVAWQVIRSGRPAMLHRETQLSADFLVRALLYVPLEAPGAGTIGILGVVNRVKDEGFSENQLFAVSSIADFAAIALENARLFAVRELERSRLSGILERAAEAIIVTDAQNQLWLWSDEAARLFGIEANAQGRLLEEYVDNEGLRSLFALSEQQSGVIHSEVTLADGRVYNAQLSTIETIGHIAVMQDITHLKELDRLKSEFVSTVSHDLRTPLTTIQGYVELLGRAGPLNEMQQNFVGRALSSLSHITALISDLLDIGRIEAGYDLEMGKVRMDELIQTTADATQAYAISVGIDLIAELPRSPLWVWGNSRRLRQVLDNLIGNAIKYNRTAGWVKISARQADDHVVVLVSDSGIGIAPGEESKIFDRFYRIQSPETEAVAGTGLGLAIVKSVIEKHKGRIWLESVLGVGSTFTFVLPVHDSAG